MMTITTLVFTKEYQILLSILSTLWFVVDPPPVFPFVVVGGRVVVSGLIVVSGGNKVGVGGTGLGGKGSGSGTLLLSPVTKQYTLKYSSRTFLIFSIKNVS